MYDYDAEDKETHVAFDGFGRDILLAMALHFYTGRRHTFTPAFTGLIIQLSVMPTLYLKLINL